jgi:hypothetical protein
MLKSDFFFSHLAKCWLLRREDIRPGVKDKWCEILSAAVKRAVKGF